MFFIGLFGVGAKAEPAGRIYAGCRCCHSPGPLQLSRKYQYFHAFFLPLFRFHSQYFATCPACASIYEVEPSAGDRPAAKDRPRPLRNSSTCCRIIPAASARTAAHPSPPTTNSAAAAANGFKRYAIPFSGFSSTGPTPVRAAGFVLREMVRENEETMGAASEQSRTNPSCRSVRGAVIKIRWQAGTQTAAAVQAAERFQPPAATGAQRD